LKIRVSAGILKGTIDSRAVADLNIKTIRVYIMSKRTVSELALKTSNLSDLIGYQGGAIVSRALIDKKAGTVTLFAFDESQGLSEHTSPFDALIYVLDGEVAVTAAGKALSLKQGEATILPANQPHALTAKTRFKMLLTMIKS
jgi:quercetin dioxygenase-like cupin family protein